MDDSAAGLAGAVAIVGIGFRLPGDLTNLADLWSALSAGRDLVTTVPADRFDPERFRDPNPRRPAKTYTTAGGFLENLAGFDADFFGISPREANHIDPQQRLMLEAAVEAMEDAGMDLAAIAGSDTAVFVGSSYSDYGALQVRDPSTITAHTSSGIAQSNIANRVSYALDLRGPSLTLDTACSSALVAVHQACRSLRDGESPMALTGGVSILICPEWFVAFAKASMLSPRGRCHTFSANADGYVRAEGGGFLVLKPAADAVADGDRIHAIIRGTAVNTDGRTAGMTLPSPIAQERLLRRVYQSAGVDADDLVYFEAHGTGTAVGDPIECEAIGRALGTRRTRPLPIGSIKTNIGHLEPASGVASLLKSILVLRHGRIPASLHALPLNPEIDFVALGLAPVTRATPVQSDGTAAVGVNSFGFGGTNAHVILTPPPPPLASPRPAWPLPVLVSARTEAGVEDAAQRMAAHLAKVPPSEFADICYTACRRRGHYTERALVLADDPAQAAEQLHRLARKEPTPGAARGVGSAQGSLAFAFSGNGSQWAGMGADLMAADSTFKAAVEAVDECLSRHLGWSVADVLAGWTDSALHRTEVAQPALFAIQTAVVAVLRGRGIVPAAAVGHSVGEIAAAHTAGALSLETAALIVAERSRAQESTAGQGRMAAVGLPLDEAERILVGHPGLEIAGINSDQDVTVSGDPESLADLGQCLSEQDVFFRMLNMNYGFHSAAMDPIEQRIRVGIGGYRSLKPHIPLVSTVTGEPVEEGELDADYWWRNIRRPVLFGPAARHLAAQGFDTFVEVGPHPVLAGYLQRLTGEGTAGLMVVPTLKRAADGPEAVRTAVATLIARGVQVDWDRYFPRPGRVVDLPGYPWQRERYWNGNAHTWAPPIEHPLLGERVRVTQPTWQGAIEPERLPWLADHRVGENVVMPAAAYVEMALAAGRRVLEGALEVTDLEIPRALVVPEDETRVVRCQVSLSDDDGSLRVASRAGEEEQWQVHARARVRRLLEGAPPPVDLEALRTRMHAGRLDRHAHYAMADRFGVRYGPELRVLGEIHVGESEAVASYRLRSPASPYQAHPAVVDGALQTSLALLANVADQVFLPASIRRVRAWRRPTETGFLHVTTCSLGPRVGLFDITICDDNGSVALRLDGCRLVRSDVAWTPTRAVEHYVTALRAAPRAGADVRPSAMPAPSDLVVAASAPLNEIKAAWDGEAFARFNAKASELLAHYTARAFARILPGAKSFGEEELIAAGVLDKHRRLIKVLAATTVAHGLLRPDHHHSGHTQWRPTGAAAPEPLLAAAAGEFPGCAADLTLRARCGRYLVEVLRGEVDPVELIFPDARSQTAEHFYDGFPSSRFHNRLAGALTRTIADLWPADRPLRVLEVGAGTGGLSAALLPTLPAERTQYVFTDVSEAFLSRAAARFAPYDFVEYRLLDLERDPESQGFGPADFDLVVAANVLHATADMTRTLGHVRDLLADRGMLLALEYHDAGPLMMIFGLLDGFWAFTDARLRSQGALLSMPRWTDLLTRTGFDDVARVGANEGPTLDAISLILARCADRTAGSVVFPAKAAQGRDVSWVIVAEGATDAELAAGLGQALARPGRPAPQVLRQLPGDEESWAAAGAASPEAAVVLILGHDPGDSDVSAVMAATLRRVEAIRSLTADRDAARELWVVTRTSGVLPTPEEPDVPADAAVWGATRSLANERSALAIRRISLRRGGDPHADADRLARELLTPSDEDEIVLTRAGRFVPRLVDRSPPIDLVDAVGAVPYTLELSDPGASYRLGWAEAAPVEPGPDEVVISVLAAGLNYRDVLLAEGMLPEQQDGPGRERRLGMECAGVVTAKGSAVTTFAPGDRVFAVADNTLRSHVVTKATRVGRIPVGMSFTDAATLPVAFLTVHYALEEVARLAPGEVLLVHSAAGGVGLAAVQYARQAGAAMIATAGTPEKRDLVRSLGVPHVCGSRGLDFVEAVQEVTGGRGVDVVLNSLAGEAIARGLELLRPHGRFIELGKRDIYEGNRLSLLPFRNNLGFFGIDLEQAIHRNPELIAVQFAHVAKRINAHRYRPLLNRVYPAARVAEAFALLQHSQHIGKLVISFDEPVPVERRPSPPMLDPDGTYLVTGGYGGFGAATAVWLANRGARHLALVGRRGAQAAEAQAIATDLAARGVDVTLHAADVADLTVLRKIVDDIDAGGHRLRGVVHAAMVLDDAPLAELTPDRFRAVLAPKMAGGLILDRLTRDRPLDLFLVLSSATTLFGNIKQSNYVAGNMYLEALVRARRRVGLPGLAVSLGHVGEVGYVARTAELLEAVARITPPITPREAFNAFDDLLATGADVAAVLRMDWDRLHETIPVAGTARLARVMPERIVRAEEGSADLLRELAEASEDEAEVLAVAAVRALVAEVLHATPDRFDTTTRLDQLGIDSLMGAELMALVRTRFGCEISVMEAISEGGIADLARRILDRLRPDRGER